MSSASAYRREIDGLRALAVLPVIAFHAGIAPFSGGFVGVDVFFVISGYLIGGIIWDELEAGRFTFARFYERRARRILPALLLVVTACVPLAWAWLSPADMESFGRSALAALFFVANSFFLANTGYFQGGAEHEPLLHTWSLSVEEQFYLLFPLLLISLHRRMAAQRVFVVLAAIALASFALGEWGWRQASPEAAFFLLPFRAWELLAGTLCALALRRRQLPALAAPGFAGIAAILLAMVWFDKSTPFPSAATLLPVGGTMLVILFAREGNAAARLLGLRPLVAVGLISYSAYLWHHPLFAFARARSVEEPGPLVMTGLIVLTLVLAALSWRFVEQPFRKGRLASGPRIVPLGGLAGATAALGAVCLAVTLQSGVPGRFDARLLAAYDEGRKGSPDAERCKLGYAADVPTACVFGTAERPSRRIAVIGDSTASHWLPALRSMAARQGWRIDLYAKSACPIAEVDFTYFRLKREYVECARWRDALFETLATERYDRVVISHIPTSYVRFNEGFLIPPGNWHAGVGRALDRLDRAGLQWTILESLPRFQGADPVDCAFKAAVLQVVGNERCVMPRAAALDEATRARTRSMALRAGPGGYLDLTAEMCGPRSCSPNQGGHLLMSDAVHLSEAGARRLEPLLERRLVTLLAQRDDTPAQLAGHDT